MLMKTFKENIQRKHEKDTSINDRNDEYNSSVFANNNSSFNSDFDDNSLKYTEEKITMQ